MCFKSDSILVRTR